MTAYVGVALVVFLIGATGALVSHGLDEGREATLAARAALLAPVWPVVAVWLLVFLVRRALDR